MTETLKQFTSQQKLNIRQFLRVAKLFQELDQQFNLVNKEFSFPYTDSDSDENIKIYNVDKIFLKGLRHIRNNMYLALGKDELTKEANMILEQYLTPYDITNREKLKKEQITS